MRLASNGRGGSAASFSASTFLAASFAFSTSYNCFFFSAISANFALLRSMIELSLYFLAPLMDPESECRILLSLLTNPYFSGSAAVTMLIDEVWPDCCSSSSTVAPENSMISFFVTFWITLTPAAVGV